MIKIGSCLRCGKCCIAANRFGYRVEKKLPNGKFDYASAQIFIREDEPDRSCEALIFDIKTHQAICLQQEEKREICEGYPFGPGDRIFDSCGFMFIEEVSG